MKTFLGKPVPDHAAPKAARPPRAPWSPLLIVPIIAAGALSVFQTSTLRKNTVERSTGAALSRTFAAETRGTAIDTTTVCSKEKVAKFFVKVDGGGKTTGQLIDIFPIVPAGVNGAKTIKKADGSIQVVSDDTACSPPYWGRDVIFLFAYKAMAIINWFAEAAAIILTIYAGLLYMSSFASEKNVGKAKAVLMGAYGGLIIVILAKAAIYATVNVVVSGDPRVIIEETGTNLQGLEGEASSTPTPTPPKKP